MAKIIKKTRQKKEKLNINNDDRAAEVVNALTAMIHTEGWKIMKQIFDTNIEYLETQIIEKKDIDGNILSDAEVDNLRNKLGYLKEVIGTPESLISKLTQKDMPKENFDPYYQSILELRQHK